LGRLPLALANFFDPSVKLPLALSKGLCHKQPIETKQTKESNDENHHTHTDPDHVFPARR